MRGKKATGGSNLAADDLKSKPMKYTADSNVERESEERKSGGRTKKCAGGTMRKEGGKVEGKMEKMRADRKPRKSGGSATSNPFSSARGGTNPAGHKTMDMD